MYQWQRFWRVQAGTILKSTHSQIHPRCHNNVAETRSSRSLVQAYLTCFTPTDTTWQRAKKNLWERRPSDRHGLDIEVWHKSVRLISNRCWSEGLCYLGYVHMNQIVDIVEIRDWFGFRFRWWLVVGSVLNHYLNQCWLIVNWTLVSIVWGNICLCNSLLPDSTKLLSEPMLPCNQNSKEVHVGPLLLIWINFNPSVDQ